MGIKCRDKHKTLIHDFVDGVYVGLNSDDAVLGEGGRGVTKKSGRPENVGDYNGLEDVELEVAVATADRRRDVVTEHLGAYHRQGLALSWIHLSRHDRATRLVLGQ